MEESISIVGMACRYPGADDVGQLWQNILAKRRSFRRMPDVRLRLDDYFDADHDAVDKTYGTQAAVLTGWSFDRLRFRVAGSTHRQTDHAHWLALEVAAGALADAGFPGGEGLSRDATGVLVGNTLTGEFSRAQGLRLRWPFVRRTLEAALAEGGVAPGSIDAVVDAVGERFRGAFEAVDEDTLAGGLSNTIAGRICNAFDLRGAGYTIDGACSSSLLAVTNACSALVAGDLDTALVGGVDLSLDPFEIVGFAKTGALAETDMRVFDARSSGFWPGEGCGFVVLMRTSDAVAAGRRIYATLRGWGMSSDGKGGITRPAVGGQRLALARAYRRAGYGIDTVTYFEGHGTGTAVGDATELQTLVGALEEAGASSDAPPVLGTIKALIGHTKAASGIAGLLKATLAIHHRILPPTAGQLEPHPILAGTKVLRTPPHAEPWPEERAERASVSAMGFGGINVHVTLEAPAPAPATRPRRLRPEEQILARSHQDAELLVFDADDVQRLATQLEAVAAYASDLSFAELADLAATLAATGGDRRLRAAVVARSPEELGRGLRKLRGWIEQGGEQHLDPAGGVFLAATDHARVPRIGLLFPGQGSPANLSGGIWRQRFESVACLYKAARLPARVDGADTEVVQPAIACASWAAAVVLEELGLHADVAVGHSLGELSALAWAGAVSGEGLLRIARARGRAMADLGSPTGAMVALEGAADEAHAIAGAHNVHVACLNAPDHTVLSGARGSIEAASAQARAAGLKVTPLAVSHAFHSPLVADAAPALGERLGDEALQPLRRLVVSTVTGAPLEADAAIDELLTRGVLEPVRFVDALRVAADGVDLFIEVGPGHALSALAPRTIETPVVSLDASGASLRGLLCAVAAAWTLGAQVRPSALFMDRFHRPFPLDWSLDVLANPCSVDAPAGRARTPLRLAFSRAVDAPEVDEPGPDPATTDEPLELVRQLVAERVELPVGSIHAHDRMLSDLHLNSIMVAEIASEAARLIGAPPLASPTSYADAEIGQLAAALDEIVKAGDGARPTAILPPGVASWVRAFSIDWIEQACPPRPAADGDTAEPGRWSVVAPAAHPMRGALLKAVASLSGDGVIVCLPLDRPATLDDLGPALAEARALSQTRQPSKYVLVQPGHGAAGLAKTLHLEAPKISVCVLNLPPDLPAAVDRIVEEAASLRGFVECCYDAHGVRRVPRMTRWIAAGEPAAPLDSSDVILITGGGKGITAECALDLALWTGASLALVGRSDPERDTSLANNLERMHAMGVRASYFQADVLDPRAIERLVAAAGRELGPITAVLHGAGRNVPELIAGLTEDAMRATFGPKVQGLRNILAAVDPDRLRLLVGFGSIIGRSGLRGNADYAVANEWLAAEIASWARSHPKTRTLTLEWSVWAGVGMGDRLGTLDALEQQGITAITIDEGLAWMRRLLSSETPPSVVVAGRHGDLPTLRPVSIEVPFLRFVDEIVTLTPGVEIVVETLVSVSTDPYLDDHVFKGQRLLPAVLGFEAMAQVASVLLDGAAPTSIADAVFRAPIVVPSDRPVTLRVAALLVGPGEVHAVVRARDSGFSVDCFSATLRYGPPSPDLDRPAPSREDLSLEVIGDIYGSLLFHGGRFRRIEAYQQIRASGCCARAGLDAGRPWFAPYLSPALLLGDPALLDATIHAHQPAFPHSPLLPRSVADITLFDLSAPGPWSIVTRETSRNSSGITVDVTVRTLEGRLRARWRGLELVTVAGTEFDGPWPEQVLGAYLEHQLSRFEPGNTLEAVVSIGGSRLERRARAALALRGAPLRVYHRPDGKPELADRTPISFSHSDDLTLAVTSRETIACDVQRCEPRRPEQWRALLGDARAAVADHLASLGPDPDEAATCVWAAAECMQKAGQPPAGALIIRSHHDGWSTFEAGNLVIRARAFSVRRFSNPIVVAIATNVEQRNARSSG